VVRLQPREDSPVLFDVQVEHTPRVSKGRPPQSGDRAVSQGLGIDLGEEARQPRNQLK
jgi:hypothetical protein